MGDPMGAGVVPNKRSPGMSFPPWWVCRASTQRAERRTQEGPKTKLERLLKAVDRVYCSGKSYVEFFGLRYF